VSQPESVDETPTFLNPQPPVLRLGWPSLWWANVLLFGATLVSTTAFGYALHQSFSIGFALDFRWIIEGYVLLVRGNPALWKGLQFSLPLLVILLSHEFGHYFDCRRWGVDASLPYFLPSPTLFGTFGAFIRIRSPIYSRRALFDIGVAGPIAGFVVLIPFLIGGVLASRVMPVIPHSQAVSLGTPLALRLVELIRFPGVPASHISLHPVAVAAWAGLLATAINLLPMGQLDGGHILYAVFGERLHRIITLAFIASLVAAGFFYWAWWIWAAVMFLFGRRHPLVYDETPLSKGRLFSFGVAVAIFVLSICVVPVSLT